MNILFLTMNIFTEINMRNIYSDLMLKFIREGHKPYIVTPREKKSGEETELMDFGDHAILKVKVGNLSNVSLIEKGISTVMIENNFKVAIDKHLKNVKFDLILYSTPPITFSGVIKKLKKDGTKTYLMLKDIFPQNAVDLGMFSKKSPIYHFFRNKERTLYKISDHIGCMSPKNVEYVLKNNKEISPEKVEICPNCIAIHEKNYTQEQKDEIRRKYGIPLDKKVFLYGGNLGKPQGIDFLKECLESQKDNNDAFFVIVGSGSELGFLQNYHNESAQKNLLVMSLLPKADYDILAESCDIGMLFLDKRFTIPNFPSRLLSYMQSRMPVLSVTDANTDVGDVVEAGNFGWKCISGDLPGFNKAVDEICSFDSLTEFGNNAFKYLEENYDVSIAYNAIMSHF